MASIVDVARKAGVSIATVSRVVNQPSLVRPDTLDRVTSAMTELGYNPNPQAHSLRSGRAKTIALLVGDVSAPFFGALARALSREGQARGYSLVLYDLDHSADRLISVLSRLHRTESSGVVIALSAKLQTAEIKAAIAAAQARGLQVVTNSQIVDDTVPAVLPRFDVMAEDAVRHLLGLGARSLIFVGGSKDAVMTTMGERGFFAACAEAGLGADKTASVEGHFLADPTRDAVGSLLAEDASFQASDGQKVGVICQTTRMAMGAMMAAFDAGLSVADDLSILCCEELPQESEWHPELSTMAVPMEDLGKALFNKLHSDNHDAPHHFLEHRLIARGSTDHRVSSSVP